MRCVAFAAAMLLACPALVPASCFGQERRPDNTQTERPTFRLQGGVLVPVFRREGEKGPIEPARVTAPHLLKSVDSQIPKGGKLTGSSILSVIVGLDGQPEKILVKESLRPDYDEKAMEAVRQFRFEPAKLDGQDTAMQININVHVEPPV